MAGRKPIGGHDYGRQDYGSIAFSASPKPYAEPLLAKIVRKGQSSFQKHVGVYWPRPVELSQRPVTVLVPLALKDMAQAERSIAGLRQHLKHPIVEIVVPGQDHPDIAAFCARLGLRYVNENSVLPEAVKSLDYRVNGHNRNGWMRQQILKLDAFRYCGGDAVFICDSDTTFIRDVAFFEKGRQVLLTSDDYISHYHGTTQRLLGPVPRHSRSFIAHCMLMQRPVLAALQQEIERRHAKPWQLAILDCIDRSQDEGFSEYELYGNWLMSSAPKTCVTRYWYNRKVNMASPADFVAARQTFRHFNSLSSHIHLYRLGREGEVS